MYDPLSPSGLRWARSRGTKKKGSVAGHFDNTCGYWRVARHPRLLAHIVIWKIHNGDIPNGMIVDHEDGNKTNNLIGNLRLIPSAKNTRNSRMYKSNSSGITGVCYIDARPERGISARWSCHWYDLSGKLKTKSFSISVYGELAEDKAIEYRIERITELNQQGAGYTERHGKGEQHG